MTNHSIRARIAALSLLASSGLTAQVYLSDYLGTPQLNCCTFSANPPYVTTLIAGAWGVGIDTAHTFANCQPIELRHRATFRKGIGMNPNNSQSAVAEFDLDAIRAVVSQPLDVDTS